MMKGHRWITWMILALLLLPPTLISAQSGTTPQVAATAMGTAFTYQGRLMESGAPADGTYDFHFVLYDAESGGSQIGPALTVEDVTVSNGLFTVLLDFGAGAFAGEARWLEIGVRHGDETGDFTLLTPRQALTPAPHALYAATAPWSGLSGVPAGLADGDDDTLGELNCTSGQIAKWDGSVWKCAADDTGDGGSAPDDAWLLGGNLDTDPDLNYVGTSDDVMLTLSVNHTPTLRLIPTSGTSNIIGGHSHNEIKDNTEGAFIGGGGSGTEGTQFIDEGSNFAFIGGGVDNGITGIATSIVGGAHNDIISSDHAFIGGGEGNEMDSSDYAVIAGGGTSKADHSDYAVIGGGIDNTIEQSEYAVIGGGNGNINKQSSYAVIGGGRDNTLLNSSVAAVIAGGSNNKIDALYAAISGGFHNTIGGYNTTYAIIGGGYTNIITNGRASVIGGGEYNVIDTHHAFIGGGAYNVITSSNSFIGGGGYNEIQGSYSVIGGGGGANINEGNFIGDSWCTIGGGHGNEAGTASGYNTEATVGGGGYNTASSSASTVSGGYMNLADDAFATVGGGHNNTVEGESGTIAGGHNNTIDGNYSTIGGGQSNIITGTQSTYGTIGGGSSNTVEGMSATIGGGSGNKAKQNYATVAGGASNTADGEYATVGGGSINQAQGTAATIPGGYQNAATNYAFAAGRQAKANATGCFVWGDSTDDDVSCVTDNRTIFRSSGGFYIYTNSGLATGAYLSANGSSWNAVSDRNRKENFEEVDTQLLLERLAAIPITTWNYKSQDPSIRHIGPMAQDFNALLPDLGGEGETYINSMDADGVALAAIQALYAQNQELAAENAELKAQVDDLEARLAALEAAVEALAAQSEGGQP